MITKINACKLQKIFDNWIEEKSQLRTVLVEGEDERPDWMIFAFLYRLKMNGESKAL